MNEEKSQLVIALAQEFVNLLQKKSPSWRRGFFRFYLNSSRRGSNASFENLDGISLIGALENNEFYSKMNKLGHELIEGLGKEAAVFLLSISSDLNYKIDFEFENLDRWKISKMDGGTGIPED